ncbi:MAG: hypothetical protein LBU42_00135 [Prevotellaceae bacterium]|jgi:hypothetical protein|nr:hypothetical protein [Prevotellaceae bacterium]
MFPYRRFSFLRLSASPSFGGYRLYTTFASKHPCLDEVEPCLNEDIVVGFSQRI